jgi:hypothetical protein
MLPYSCVWLTDYGLLVACSFEAQLAGFILAIIADVSLTFF